MYGPTLLGVSVALENVAAVTNKRYFTGSLNLTKLTNSYYTLHQTVLHKVFNETKFTGVLTTSYIVCSKYTKKQVIGLNAYKGDSI